MSSDSAASNHLVGTVVRMDRGMAGGAGGECAIELPGGIVLVGFAREHHGLRRGIQARANVAASSVVLALPPW
jgi:molybdopterin-binding protein